MMWIQCETAHFRGHGTFTCHKCATVTELHSVAAVLLVLPTVRLVVDSKTGTVIHDCAWSTSADAKPTA